MLDKMDIDPESIPDVYEPEVFCGECGSPMVLRNGPYKNPFWGCSRYPDCTGSHGAHSDGRPLGVPANKITKEARIEAHKVFDRLWAGPDRVMNRTEAYRLLAARLNVDEIHIGSSDLRRCGDIIRESSMMYMDYREAK